MVDIRMYSFNVRGLRDKVKRKIVFNHLMTKYPKGIYLLQETHSTPDVESTWKKDWPGGEIYFSHGKNDSCGVATLVYKDLDVNVSNIQQDENGRCLSMNVSVDQDEFDVFNIYALQYVKDKCIELSSSGLVLGGDFNTTIFDADLDKQGGTMSNCTNLYTEELTAFMDAHDLFDVIRFRHPGRRLFTRIQRTPPVMTRIDHWLMSY